jgi:outer membrane protein
MRNAVRGLYWLLLSAGLTGVPALALAAQPPMTLGDAISYALDHNAAIAQQSQQVAAAEHTLATQAAQTFPTVNAQVQNLSQKSSNYNTYAIISVVPQSVFSQNTAQITTQYNLNLGGLALVQLTADRALVAQARQTLANSEDRLASTVTDDFFAVAQKRSIVRVDRSALAYQNALVAAAKAKLKAGTAAGVDVMRTQISQDQSRSSLIGALADAQNARESLAQAIGAPLSTSFVIPNPIPQPPLPSGSVRRLEAMAQRSRPDVQAARQALLAAQETRKGWDRELFPQVSLTAGFGNQFSPTLAVQEQQQLDQALGHAAPTVSRGSPGFWDIGATTTFTLPLVDYGQRHFERVADNRAIDSAQVTLNQTRSQAELDVSQAYRNAQTALTQLGYARAEAALGLKSAQIAQLQYKTGVIALADVFQAEQTSVQAQSDLIAARVAYVDAVVSLRVALGIYDARSAVADLNEKE